MGEMERSEHDRDPKGTVCRELLVALDDLHLEARKPTSVTNRGTEIDVWAAPHELDAIARRLGSIGFAPFRSVRSTDHRFFLRLNEDGWTKVDVKVRARQRTRLLKDVCWLLRKKRGLVVALLGADGAGKSTATQCLEVSMPFDVVAKYLGATKPSTPAGTRNAQSKRRWRSYPGAIRWMARTALQLWAIEVSARRGRVIICDRHPIEAGRLGGEPSAVRATKRLFTRLFTPSPDLVLLLDAPGTVLFARKGEHSPAVLDRMTARWREATDEYDGVTVSAEQNASEVCQSLQTQIWEQLREIRSR